MFEFVIIQSTNQLLSRNQNKRECDCHGFVRGERGGWPWREPSEEEVAKLQHRFLAQVVRALWGESASYEVLNQGDEGVARAVHALLDEQAFFRAGGAVSLGLTNQDNIIHSNNEEHGF